jgi:hypothetical protein
LLIFPLSSKPGDWIEYAVSTTGVPSEGHDVVWARMKILSISHGEVLAVNTTTKAVNGSFSSLVMTLDPAIGKLKYGLLSPQTSARARHSTTKTLATSQSWAKSSKHSAESPETPLSITPPIGSNAGTKPQASF